jgi:hypothetical protein
LSRASQLFDPALDDLEDGEVGRWLGNLGFEDWFKPFRAGEPVHPYVDRGGTVT